jgi:repressor LexA
MAERGMSQRRLSKLSGVDRGHINKLLKGETDSITFRIARALAHPLNISPTIFLESNLPEIAELHRSLRDVLLEAEGIAQHLEVFEIPLRGSVPAGTPFPEEENLQGTVELPRSLLVGITNLDKLYALTVSGDSLIGDSIEKGDYVIVDPTQTEIIDGKIYIILLDNESVTKHVYKLNDKVKLVSSNSEFQELEVDQLQIQGKVILGRGWRKY